VCGARCGLDPVCVDCVCTLPVAADPACAVCALPLPTAGVCGRCLKRPPAFDASRAALAYTFPVDRLVQAFKYRHRLGLAAYFSGLVAELGPPDKVDCVVPLPMHPHGLRKRGFNQAVELARPLARAWQLPLWLDAVARTRDGPPQASLDGLARRRNVRGAFAADPARFAGRSVLVVDDVMTTGATLQALARELKRAGAVRVENVVVARTFAAR
jgi:ComF family protein